MKNGKYIGVWVDYKKAVIATCTPQKQSIKKINSDIERWSKTTGGVGRALPYSFDGGSGQAHKEHRRENALKKYYKEICKAINGSTNIFIMGPGLAKKELSKAMKKEVTFVTKPKMTDAQIMAQTRKYFNLGRTP